MAAGSIVVDLLLKTGSFETDTDRAAKSLKKLKAEADKIGTAIGVGVTAGAIGLVALVKSTIDAQDHLNDLAQKTGVAADTLGGIGFAASKAGSDLEGAAAGLGKLNKTIAEASAGNKEAQEAFTALGISVKDAAGQTKNADVLLAEVAGKFEQYQDGPEKAALALRLFGKAGADLIPLLNGGSKALQDQVDYFKKYSGVTAETAAAADTFNDTLANLKLLSGAFGKQLTAELLPSLQNLADLWLENKQSGDQLRGTATELADILKTLAASALAGGLGFVAFGKALGGTLAAVDAARNFRFADAFQISKDVLDDLGAAKAKIGGIYDAITGGRKKVAGTTDPAEFASLDFVAGPKKKAPKLSGGDKAEKAKPDDFKRLLKEATDLQSAADLLLNGEDDLTNAQKAGAKIAAEYAAGLLKLTPAQLQEVDALLKIASATEKDAEAKKRGKQATLDAASALESFLQQQQGLTDSLKNQTRDAQDQLAEFGLTRAEIDKLASARLREAAAALKMQAIRREERDDLDPVAKEYRKQADALLATADARDKLTAKEQAVHYDAITGGTLAIKDYLDEVARAGDTTYQIVSDATKGLEDLLATAIKGGDLKSAAKSLVDTLIAEFIRLKVVKPLLASIFGGGGGLGGGIGGLLNAFNIGTSGNNYNGASANPSAPNYVNSFDKATYAAPLPKAARNQKSGGNVYIANNGSAQVSAKQNDDGDFEVVIEEAARRGKNKLLQEIASGGDAHKVFSGTYGINRAAGAPRRG